MTPGGNVVKEMPRTSPGEEMAWWFLRPWLAGETLETGHLDAIQYIEDSEGQFSRGKASRLGPRVTVFKPTLLLRLPRSRGRGLLYSASVVEVSRS